MTRYLLPMFLCVALFVNTSPCQAFVAHTHKAIAFSQRPATSVSPTTLMMSEDFLQETPEDTKERIQELVDNHPVLLFMVSAHFSTNAVDCDLSPRRIHTLIDFSIVLSIVER